MRKLNKEVQKERIYRINFVQKGAKYEIYARHISHGSLLGFLEVEDIIFGETSSVVVDPSEERLRQEFKDVTCTFLPLHTINRIDEVEKVGRVKITEFKDENNLVPFPIFQPTNTDSELSR